MNEQLIPLLILTAVVSGFIGLLFKIAFDWMKGKKNNNPGRGLVGIVEDQARAALITTSLQQIQMDTVKTNMLLGQILSEIKEQRDFLQTVMVAQKITNE